MKKPQDEKYWKNRPTNDPKKDWAYEGDWIEGYHKSKEHSHRKLIIEGITNLLPLESILEVGCNIGPNLALIQEYFSDIKLTGIDINEQSILKAQKLFEKVDFRIGSITKLPFENKSFDVLLADAVLMYVPPEKIYQVIKELDRVTRKAMIFLEWHDKSIFGKVKEYHWTRNYKKLMEEFGYKVEIKKIPKELWPTKKWHKLGRTYTSRAR